MSTTSSALETGPSKPKLPSIGQPSGSWPYVTTCNPTASSHCCPVPSSWWPCPLKTFFSSSSSSFQSMAHPLGVVWVAQRKGTVMSLVLETTNLMPYLQFKWLFFGRPRGNRKSSPLRSSFQFTRLTRNAVSLPFSGYKALGSGWNRTRTFVFGSVSAPFTRQFCFPPGVFSVLFSFSVCHLQGSFWTHSGCQPVASLYISCPP